MRRLIRPDLELIEEYKSELVFPETRVPIEFDAFIPQIKLAIEYQGKQHYEDTMIFGLAEQYKGFPFFIIYYFRII